MNKVNVLETLDSIKSMVELFPDGLEVLSISSAFRCGNENREVHLYESYQTLPDRFYEFADRCGAEVIHGNFTEETTSLSVTVNGITYFVLVDKEVLDNDANGTETA